MIHLAGKNHWSACGLEHPEHFGDSVTMNAQKMTCSMCESNAARREHEAKLVLCGAPPNSAGECTARTYYREQRDKFRAKWGTEPELV